MRTLRMNLKSTDSTLLLNILSCFNNYALQSELLLVLLNATAACLVNAAAACLVNAAAALCAATADATAGTTTVDGCCWHWSGCCRRMLLLKSDLAIFCL